MSVFTEQELAYLRGQRLGRLATADASGRPHVVPAVFQVDPESGAIEIGARDLKDGRGQRRRYRRQIEANPHVAFVVDDLASVNPWTPRGITMRGVAEIRPEGGERLGPGFGPAWIRIVPTWVSSWGIETGPYEPPYSRRTSAG